MSAAGPVRMALVGAGHLGRHHARILSELPGADLVGIVDIREDRARELGEKHGVPWARGELPPEWRAEAVSVVVPTRIHGDIVAGFLEAGLDVLVEKPMTRTIAEGERLCELAERNGRILQVGHVERFNPVVKALLELSIEPRYIEGDRLAPFTFRSTDIGVVLDLMIHDLDLVLSMVDCPLVDVEAFGGGIFTPAEDLASARLKFEDGTIARLTANRVALKPSRRMRMFSKDSYVSLDFEKQYGLIIMKAPGWDLQKLDLDELDPENIPDLRKFVFEGLLTVRELDMAEGNPLGEEILEFLACVRSREPPLVDGPTGLHALRMAWRVLDSIGKNHW